LGTVDAVLPAASHTFSARQCPSSPPFQVPERCDHFFPYGAGAPSLIGAVLVGFSPLFVTPGGWHLPLAPAFPYLQIGYVSPKPDGFLGKTPLTVSTFARVSMSLRRSVQPTSLSKVSGRIRFSFLQLSASIGIPFFSPSPRGHGHFPSDHSPLSKNTIPFQRLIA